MNDILKYYIEQIESGNIEVDAPMENTQQTLIHFAASLNDIEAIEELIKLKADLGKKNPFGDDAIHTSLNAESIEASILLLRNGASPKSVDNFGKTVIDKVLDIGDAKLSRFFVDHCRSQQIEIDYKEPMRVLMRRSNSEISGSKDGLENDDIVAFQLKKIRREITA